MTQIPPEDTQYRDLTITGVQDQSDGGYAIRLSDGWSILCPAGPFVPQVGQAIRLYGTLFGHIRGIVIEGEVFRYQTVQQAQAELDQMRQQAEDEARARYAERKADIEARIAVLPDPFRKRMEGFLRRAPETAWKHQEYELVTCEAALEILKACPTLEVVDVYAKANYADQIQLTPALEPMDLSGNMHACAIALARFMRRGQEDRVWQSHATICPVVGCAEAGCWATERQGDGQ